MNISIKSLKNLSPPLLICYFGEEIYEQLNGERRVGFEKLQLSQLKEFALSLHLQ